MTPGLTDGTYGPTEVVTPDLVTPTLTEMLDRPGVDHVLIRRVDGEKAAAQAKAKAKRRTANKNARRARRQA